MTEFLLALVGFLAAHALPAVPRARQRLIERLGRRLYLSLYSLLSLALLGWLLSAAGRAPHVALWPPSPALHLVPLVVMPLSLMLVGAGLAEPSAVSVSLRRPRGADQAGGVAAVTRHPVLWGFLLWAAAHLVANGDLVAAVLFGAMALFSAAGMAGLDARARRRLGDAAWSEVAARTSLVPFAAILAGRARPSFGAADLVGAAAGLAVYVAFVFFGLHAALFGADPVAFWR